MSRQADSSPPSSPVPSQAAPVAKGKSRATSPPSTPIANQTARDALAKGRAQVAANVTYSVALQNLGPGSIHSSQRRARIAVRTSTPVPQQQQPLQTPPPLQTTPHPNDPIQTKHRWKITPIYANGLLNLSKLEHSESSCGRRPTFPQGPSDGRYLSSSSSDEFSNGLITLNLGAGRPISVESDISTVINKRNTTNDNDNFNRLKIYDTVFIVDDIGSMVLTARDDDLEGQDRWNVTKEALWHVTALAAAKDDDRIDIRFLISTSLDKDHITSITKVMEIRDRLDVLDAFRGGGTGSRTEICPRLEFFGQYREQDAASKSTNSKDLARIKRPQPPKKLSNIVITDGQADDKQEVEDLIVETARELDIKGSRGSGWNAVRADW